MVINVACYQGSKYTFDPIILFPPQKQNEGPQASLRKQSGAGGKLYASTHGLPTIH